MSVIPTKILLATDGSDEAADGLSTDTGSRRANRTFANARPNIFDCQWTPARLRIVLPRVG